MQIIGHRGCAEQYPENTLQAVRRAAEHVDAVEVDVRRCGSGELVVFHDKRVDRLTDGSGRLADLSLPELQRLEVLDSGESIPRLSAVLAAVPEAVALQLELKETGLAADVRRAVADADRRVTVTSFRRGAIEAVDELGWDVPTGYLFETDPGANVETAAELGCRTVHPHYDCCLDTDVVAMARERGLDVVAWKAVQTSEEVAALREAGVDGVTADRWDLAPAASEISVSRT